MTQTKTTPETSEVNLSILAEREKQFNQVAGPRVGDYLLMPYGLYTRFTHAWDETIQTGGGSGSFFFGSGYCSYSGGLDSGVSYTDLIETTETKKGAIWFFDKNISGAGRGVYFEIPFRVFTLKEGANTNGLPQIKAYEKKLLQDKAEKITRINGNGNEYTTPLPELVINAEELNDVYLNHLEKQTGLRFIKSYRGQSCYVCQPMTCQQFTLLMLSSNFTTKYYSNWMWDNTLFLTFNKG
jgi:hypothetical protein